MHIALVSDSHDHIPHTIKAVRRAQAMGAEQLVHCGDLISPFMLRHLAAFPGPVHLIYGNNAGDLHLITKMCLESFPSITHHGPFGALEADERRIAFVHYPQMARGLAVGGEYDVVCCGHTHRFQVETVGGTLLINCGQVFGIEEEPGFVLLDCATLATERVVVARQVKIQED